MTTPKTFGNEGQHSGGGFTPGPWECPRGHTFVRTHFRPGGATFLDAGFLIADTSSSAFDPEVRRANARLIAAAPDHHAVSAELRRLELVIESAVRSADFAHWQEVCDLLNANRAALSKALGTAPGSVGEGDVSARNQPCADADSPRSPDNHSLDGKEEQ